MSHTRIMDYNHKEGRSEYADHNEPQQSGYSAGGRKLRPRRNAGPAASSSASGEYRSYDNHRNFGHGREDGERRPYSQNRTEGRGQGYGQRRSFNHSSEDGERRPYSQNRTEGRGQSYGQRRSFGHGGEDGERRPYSQNRTEGRGQGYGQNRSFGHGGEDGERRPYSQNRTEGRGQGYGQHRSFGHSGEDGERRPYSQNRTEGRGQSYGQRRSFGHGDKPSFGKPAGKFGGKRNFNNHFTEKDEEGISQMISKRPQISDNAFSDNDNVATPIKEEMRLNKFIANSGVCSRREADNFILAGVVTVNGEVVTELGSKVNVITDDIRFNGEKLRGEEKVYIVMNKPKGFVTSTSDPHADRTVMDLLSDVDFRVFPVGRLDKNTTGVLMFTNDGEIAEQLTHPSYNKKKIYQVILDKALDDADKEKILTVGLDLSDGNIKADELEFIDAQDHRRLGIEIHSGKNRIVRRIFESLGYEVKALDRVYFAGLTKKGLKKGEWRYLTAGEINVLKMGAYV